MKDHRIARLEPSTERAPAFSAALYGTTPWPGTHGETVVSLGIAGAAIDALLDLVVRKKPSYSRFPLHHREMAQHHAGEAAALVDASRTFLHSAISEAYADAERAGRLSETAKIRCQLAACFGARSCAQAVDLVHEVAGTSAIRLEYPFERHHRDIHVLTQHATKSWARYADVGRMLFGMPPDFFTLEL